MFVSDVLILKTRRFISGRGAGVIGEWVTSLGYWWLWILRDYNIWISVYYYIVYISLGLMITDFKLIFNTETRGKFKDLEDFIKFGCIFNAIIWWHLS